VIRLTSFVASSYVADLDESRRFYAALGFVEQRTGYNDVSAWSYLSNDRHFILLASSQPPMPIPALPLLFYFFVHDLAAAGQALADIGVMVEHVGYPPHALGGEARLTDPDGNTILLGQAQRSPSQPEPSGDDPGRHFSLLREAATLAQHRAGAGIVCQLYASRDRRCGLPAEVKLADSWGDTTWACLNHAETVLVNAPGVFIANQDSQGLGPYLALHRPADDR
jgi:catechol 2,3-dioxygenase-like lactoylglutathione lyase family enzyme